MPVKVLPTWRCVQVDDGIDSRGSVLSYQPATNNPRPDMHMSTDNLNYTVDGEESLLLNDRWVQIVVQVSVVDGKSNQVQTNG